MAQVVTPGNLGNEFDLGVIEADKIHLKIDGTSIVRNGITGTLSSVGAGAGDFWRTNAGVLPDGLNDLTEAIRHNGPVGINRNALSELDTGSFGMGVAAIATGATLNLTDIHHTVILGGNGSTATVILPAANTCRGREYCIRIATGVIPTTSVITLQSLGGTIETISGTFTAVGGSVLINQAFGRGGVWQSDGRNWYLIQHGSNLSILPDVTLADIPANGAIGTAATTVDIGDIFRIPQSTPNIVASLPVPTVTTPGRIITVINTGTVPIHLHGVHIENGATALFTNINGGWVRVSDIDRQFTSTNSPFTASAPFFTPNSGQNTVVGGVSTMPASTVTYSMSDGDFVGTISLPPATGRRGGLTLRRASTGTFTIVPTNTDLGANTTIPNGSQIHFYAAGDIWRWSPVPVYPVVGRREYAATGTTDAAGNVTIAFPAGTFSAVPVVSLAVQTANTGVGEARITALSATSLTVQVLQTLALPAAKVIVHVIATNAGSTTY